MKTRAIIRNLSVLMTAALLIWGCQAKEIKDSAKDTGQPGPVISAQYGGEGASLENDPKTKVLIGKNESSAQKGEQAGQKPPPPTSSVYPTPSSAVENIAKSEMEERLPPAVNQPYPQHPSAPALALPAEGQRPLKVANRNKESDYCRLPSAPMPRSQADSQGVAAPPSREVVSYDRATTAAKKMTQAIPPPQGDPSRPTYIGFGEVFDEVWVIQRPDAAYVDNSSPMPGCGELRAVIDDIGRPGIKKELPFPLKHTDVKGRVDGFVASVNVSQLYENPYSEKIEAVYLFPLPQNAAVSDFVMIIGERRIRGIIREREEAKRIYEEARNQGYQAALLQQERPNVFTQKVANIEPGNAITVEIQYFDILPYVDGEYEFAFPMVVGPRFNPPGFYGGIDASPRGVASSQAANVQYLAPGERNGHDISISLEINAGMEIEAVKSETHVIKVDKKSKETLTAKIAASDSLPNKDFVLRYRLAGGRVKTGLLVEKTENGGYFSLVLQPPAELSAIARTPLELVFVVDTSGSMAGWPIETAKKAMLRALRNLNAEDTFQIIRFGNDSSAFSRAPLAATGENIRQAADFVQNLQASGGTMMIEGVKNALNFPHDPKRLRVVSFMTDGFIGNEAEILAAVNQLLGPSRIFSFGIGSSVNRYLIDNLAKFGRGAVAYVTTNSSPIEAIDKFYDVIAHQTLNNVSIDLAGVKTSGVYPEHIPDLFIGRPVVVTGRFSGEMPETITVRGTVAGEPRLFKARTDTGTEAKGISKLWARARIADYSNRIITEGPKNDLVYQVRETALAHNLVSDYTSFVAVDGSRRTQGDHGFTVNVPVPVPEGVRYDTTVTPSR